MNTLRRVLLIGDVHGQVAALAAALRHAPMLAVNAVLCTGDLPTKGYALSNDTAQATNAVASLLADAKAFTVRGNHDRYFAENADDPALAEMFGSEWNAWGFALEYVRSLPATRRLATVAGDLLLCHGVGTNDMAGIYPGGDDAPIVEALATLPRERPHFLVAGHTHRRMVRTVAGVTIINPGSLVGDREPPGFAVADFDTSTVTFYAMETGGAATPNIALPGNENL